MADRWGKNRVKTAAIRAGVPENAAAPVVEAAGLTPEMKELFGELTPHALAEMGMDPNVSPLGCMLVMGGLWGLGVYEACASMAAEGERRKTEAPGFNGQRAETAAPPPPPSVVPVTPVKPVDGLRRHAG